MDEMNPLAALPPEMLAEMGPGERLAYLLALDEEHPPAPWWAALLLATRA